MSIVKDKDKETRDFYIGILWFFISCFSTTYSFEWSMSQLYNCSIPVNNIGVRVGLGLIGTPTGLYLLAIPVKAIDEAFGDSDVAIRGKDSIECKRENNL